MKHRKPWRDKLDDAHAMLDPVEAGEPDAHDYLVAASRALVDAAIIPQPRNRSERATWRRLLNHVEHRISPFGCAGCLAYEATR